MSIKLMSSAWELDIPSTEKMVLLCLCDHSNDAGVCWPSVPTIAKKCSKSPRTVQAAIQWLRKEGFCSWDDTPGKPHRFTLNPRRICTPTPAESAPRRNRTPQDLHLTPAESADEPLRTTIGSEASASSPKRARKQNQFPAPEGVPESIWSDFLASPKRRKAGMSGTAYIGITNNLKLLAEHGFPPGEMIALAVERGWTTVKLEWVQNDGGRQTNQRSMGGPRPDPTLALVRSAMQAQR